MRIFALITVVLYAFLNSAEAVPLTVRIHSPQSGATFETVRGIGVSALAFGDSRVTRVEFYRGSTLAATDETAPFNFSWRFAPTDNGQHVWTARAYDAAGNVSTSAPVTITLKVDATAPKVALVGESEAGVITNPGVHALAASASDDTGVTRVEFMDNGQIEHIATASPFTYRWKVNGGDTGQHLWIARAYDAAGNRRDSEALVRTVEIARGTRPLLARTPATIVITNGGRHDFQVRNAGPGTLNYTVRTDADWLTVLPTAGATSSAQNRHVITVNATNLRHGTNAVITLVSSDEDTQTIYVHVAPESPAPPRAPGNLRVGN